MGSSQQKVASIVQYLPQEEVKGETRPFRSTERMSLTEPLPDKIEGKVDTLLKWFE